MKHFKKITAVLLALLFAISPLAGVPFEDVYAAEAITVTTAVKDGEIVKGGEVVFSVSLSAPFTGKSMALDLNAYDHNVFEWVEGSWSDAIEFSAITDINENEELAAFLNQSEITAKGEIFTFTLRVKDAANCGDTADVKVVASGISGAVMKGITVEIAHKYTNICDTDCDVCGDVRVPDQHEYDNGCDTDCNACGVTRTPPHHFVNEGDEKCDMCGYQRTVTYTVSTTVSKSTMNQGEEVTVKVILDKPRQTKSFALDFLNAYNHNSFEWISGDWSSSVKKSGVLCDVKAGSEAVFLATAGTEVPAGEIFSFVLRVKDSASCLSPYTVKVGATSIPNLVTEGQQITLIHKYSSDCDPRCNVCEKPRTPLAEHVYDNDCDENCNLCNAGRLVSHDYEFVCSSVCSLCGKTRVSDHTYSNDWDDFCNVCGETRTIERTLTTAFAAESASIGDEIVVTISLTGKMSTTALGLDFVNAYDHDAFEWVDGYWSGPISFGAYTSVNAGTDALFLAAEEITVEGLLFTMVLRVKNTANCGAQYEAKADGSAIRGAVLAGDTLTIVHGYDNVCDSDCNGCGEKREVEGHKYDNACDTDCNVCGDVRTTEHVYDNDGDEDCNECGDVRLVNRTLTTVVSVTEAGYGDEIVVTVSLDKMKKTQNFALGLSDAYDHDVFEWVSGDWNAALKNGALFAEVDEGNAAVIASMEPLEIVGEIFTFTLRLKSGDFCGKTYEITSSCGLTENITLAGASLATVHAYDNVCDPDCNGCSAERQVEGHQYDHDGDECCNNCGELRLAFYGTSLSLQHNFSINYKVKAELAEKFTDFYVKVEMNGVTTDLTEYTNDGTYLSFRFKNIAPQKIGDTVTATLYAKENGEDVETNPYDFGVKNYCEKAMEIYSSDAYSTFRTLIVDLLHYGAKAQNYTGYKTSELVDADLTAAQLAWGTQGDPDLQNHFVKDLVTIDNPTVIWRGAGLVLDSAVTLKLKFQAESVEGLTVRIKIEGGETVLISDAKHFNYNSSENCYILHVNGLSANQMSRKLELTVLDADGNAVSNTAQYSIESYAYEKQNSTIAGLADLVKAMMNYGKAAENYGKK